MPKITDNHCETEKITFKYSINVDKEGLFSTTLPKEIVEKLESAQIRLNTNRLNNKGYFCDVTLEGLRKKIKEVVEQYSKREMVEEKIVLRYSIDTFCSYCKTKKGLIVPNGNWEAEANKKEGYHWLEGTLNKKHSTKNDPFGFSVYVEPRLLRRWRFPNGDIKEESEGLEGDMIEKNSTLDWLDSLCSMDDDYREVKCIDYTEETGLFFKNMIIYICEMNEKLKLVFNDDFDIQKAIDEKGLKALPKL